MFTVKVIEPNGRERGMEVHNWTFIPEQTNLVDVYRRRLYLFRDEKAIHVDEIMEGDVYIMNNNGKTVADYHFGEIGQEENNG